MKLYMAGLYTNGTGDRQGRLYTTAMDDNERGIVEQVRYLLESYHYVKAEQRVAMMRRDGAKVFLDSGAFSAFSLGKVIDLEAYCRYIHDNPDIIEIASVLDGIGDPLKTYQNQDAMEKAGVNVLPCFHYGEDERYLEYYVEKYPYITLGGMVMQSNAQLLYWLDRIWARYLCDHNGKPKLKVHGFGMTSLPLMQRYPWYSVDSSSWVQIAFRGAVIVPGIGPVDVSDISPSRKDVGGRHAETLTEPQRVGIIERVARLGFDYDRLTKHYISRWVFNLAVFNEMNLELEKKELTFRADQITLF